MKSLVLINESTASRYGYTLTHNILPKQDGKEPPSQTFSLRPGHTFHATYQRRDLVSGTVSRRVRLTLDCPIYRKLGNFFNPSHPITIRNPHKRQFFRSPQQTRSNPMKNFPVKIQAGTGTVSPYDNAARPSFPVPGTARSSSHTSISGTQRPPPDTSPQLNVGKPSRRRRPP